MTPLVTAEQMRAVETREFERGISESELSDRAAKAISEHIAREVSPSDPVLVIAGPGNNGLDAIKVHSLLRDSGFSVSLHAWHRQDRDQSFSLEALKSDLGKHSVVLDGLFGIGMSRAVEGEAAEIVRAVMDEKHRRSTSDRQLMVLSIDIPSGLNSDTGEVMGTAFEADSTITLGLPKLGLYTGQGPVHAGEILYEPIGMNESPPDTGVLGFGQTDRIAIPPRRIGSHKNHNGRLLAIGGSLNFPQAPVMAALAAHRAGAGYVTVGFPRSMMSVIGGHLLEQTLLPLPESEPGTLGPSAVRYAAEGAADYKALVFGNGIGREEATVEFVLRLFGTQSPAAKRAIGFRGAPNQPNAQESPELPPTVVDGDALYALSTVDNWWETSNNIAVLTPHPGEMARLVSKSVDEVEADRIGIARDSAARWGKVVLLKGAYSLVAEPDGKVYVFIESHPEAASAGSGDVLAGICGFLLSLGLPPSEAARATLGLGSTATAIARDVVGRDCVTPGDTIAALPEARKRYGS